MKEKTEKILANRAKTILVLSFPSTRLLGITVNELIASAECQVKGMKAIARRIAQYDGSVGGSRGFRCADQVFG